MLLKVFNVGCPKCQPTLKTFNNTIFNIDCKLILYHYNINPKNLKTKLLLSFENSEKDRLIQKEKINIGSS